MRKSIDSIIEMFGPWIIVAAFILAILIPSKIIIYLCQDSTNAHNIAEQSWVQNFQKERPLIKLKSMNDRIENASGSAYLFLVIGGASYSSHSETVEFVKFAFMNDDSSYSLVKIPINKIRFVLSNNKIPTAKFIIQKEKPRSLDNLFGKVDEYPYIEKINQKFINNPESVLMNDANYIIITINEKLFNKSYSLLHLGE
ncbi:MAG: hypothetical protein LUQ65_02070 [Candidatus Helarchaeota archaeon]|nr:hypothetical protein [Candidatus Helarchaeota archaeon]